MSSLYNTYKTFCLIQLRKSGSVLTESGDSSLIVLDNRLHIRKEKRIRRGAICN